MVNYWRTHRTKIIHFYFICYLKGKHQAFHTIPISLLRTFSMMLGEIDFLNTYVTNSGTYIRYPIPAYIILILFMVLMPILLMNLLIGLAVGDIESVRRNAQLKRLAMQVNFEEKGDTRNWGKIGHFLKLNNDNFVIFHYIAL